MKKNIILIALVILSSCSPRLVNNNNYEIESLSTGKEGTVMFKIFSYGTSVEEAVERCKIDAIHAILFKGVPGSNQQKPLIANSDLIYEKSAYFLNFFGVDNVGDRTRNKGKTPYGIDGAPYRLYISISNDGSINPNDRLKTQNGYKVGMIVSVMRNNLKKKLEDDGLIEKFGF